MAEEVKLIGAWASPFSNRVELALKLKGINYEFFEEDVRNKSPLLQQSNPVHKKIPVLLHNGKPICESLLIVEYIDETWNSGTPILPQDPYERAVARFWAKFIDDKCMPAIWKAFWSKGGEEHEKDKKEGLECLEILENHIKDKKFFGGETLGLADIAANFIGRWFKVVQRLTEVELLTEERFPKLCEWIDNFVSCSVIKENTPDADKLFDFFKSRFETFSASK